MMFSPVTDEICAFTSKLPSCCTCTGRLSGVLPLAAMPASVQLTVSAVLGVAPGATVQPLGRVAVERTPGGRVMSSTPSVEAPAPRLSTVMSSVTVSPTEAVVGPEMLGFRSATAEAFLQAPAVSLAAVRKLFMMVGPCTAPIVTR